MRDHEKMTATVESAFDEYRELLCAGSMGSVWDDMPSWVEEDIMPLLNYIKEHKDRKFQKEFVQMVADNFAADEGWDFRDLSNVCELFGFKTPKIEIEEEDEDVLSEETLGILAEDDYEQLGDDPI